MTIWERRLALFWIFAFTWTVLAFLLGWLTYAVGMLLAFTIIGAPVALLLVCVPAITVYLTIAAVPYVPLCFWSRKGAAIVGLSVAAATGIAVPMVANHRFEERLKAFVSKDKGGPITLKAGARVAWLYDYQELYVGERTRCGELCQRLLFSGTATDVLIGPVSALNGKERLMRYWIGPARGQCPGISLDQVHADERDLGPGAPTERPLLWDKLDEIYAKGQCLYKGQATIGAANVVLVESGNALTRPDSKKTIFDSRLTRVDERMVKAVYVRRGTQLREVMRRSYVAGKRAGVPLLLVPPFELGNYIPGNWVSGSSLSVGTSFEASWEGLITNRLAVSGLPADTSGPVAQ